MRAPLRTRPHVSMYSTLQQTGDPIDLAALRPTLIRIARLHLRNDAWAEDAVSETLLAEAKVMA